MQSTKWMYTHSQFIFISVFSVSTSSFYITLFLPCKHDSWLMTDMTNKCTCRHAHAYVLLLHACGCSGRLEAVDSGEGKGRGGNVVLLQTSSRSWVQSDKVIGGQRGGGGGAGAEGVPPSWGGEEVLGTWFTCE